MNRIDEMWTEAQMRYPQYDGVWNIEYNHNQIRQAFVEGMKLADKTMIDKACKWLEDYLYEYTNHQEFIGTLCRYVHKKDAIDEFRKAMEE